MIRKVLVLLAAVACALAGLTGTATPGGAVVPTVAAAASPHTPIGAFDEVSARFDGLEVVSGWAADPDAPSQAVAVHLYLGTLFVTSVLTGDSRPDVANAVPGAGSAGWHFTVSDLLIWAAASDVLCAYGINFGSGGNPLLGCQRLRVSGASPFNPIGALDLAAPTPGLIQLRGWAGDPDGDATTEIRVYYDGAQVLEQTAALPRPDVQAAFGLSATTGFNLTLPILPGPHFVCVYAQNTGRAGHQNTTVGCVTRTIPGVGPSGAHDPRGSFDAIEGAQISWNIQGWHFWGWAYDPDTTGPINVRVRALLEYPFSSPSYAYSLFNQLSPTGKPRPDVQPLYPAAGPNAGFDGDIVGGRYGVHVIVVCAYAVNVGPGTRRLLGCAFS